MTLCDWIWYQKEILALLDLFVDYELSLEEEYNIPVTDFTMRSMRISVKNIQGILEVIKEDLELEENGNEKMVDVQRVH